MVVTMHVTCDVKSHHIIGNVVGHHLGTYPRPISVVPHLQAAQVIDLGCDFSHALGFSPLP